MIDVVRLFEIDPAHWTFTRNEARYNCIGPVRQTQPTIRITFSANSEKATIDITRPTDERGARAAAGFDRRTARFNLNEEDRGTIVRVFYPMIQAVKDREQAEAAAERGRNLLALQAFVQQLEAQKADVQAA